MTAPAAIGIVLPAQSWSLSDSSASLRMSKFKRGCLQNRSTVISDLLKEQQLQVLEGYYDLASGKLSLLG